MIKQTCGYMLVSLFLVIGCGSRVSIQKSNTPANLDKTSSGINSAIRLHGVTPGDKTFNVAPNITQLLSSGPLAARSGHTMVSVGSSIVIWGGRKSQSSYHADGAVFDLVSGQWKMLGYGPLRARAFHDAYAKEGKMTISGGQNDTDTGTSVTIFGNGSTLDVATGIWSAPFRVSQRRYTTASVVGDQVFTWGGMKYGGRELYFYSGGGFPNNGPLSRPGFGRVCHVQASIGNKIIIDAGEDESGADSRTTYARGGVIFDTITKKWSQYYSGGEGSGPISPAAAGTDSKFVIWGGRDGYCNGRPEYVANGGSVLDLASMQWTEMPHGPLSARYGLAAAAVGNLIVFWGGVDAQGVQKSDGAIFDVSTMSWLP
jgi:hypothetical protein